MGGSNPDERRPQIHALQPSAPIIVGRRDGGELDRDHVACRDQRIRIVCVAKPAASVIVAIIKIPKKKISGPNVKEKRKAGTRAGDVLHQWPMMIRGEDGLYRMPPGTPSLPLMYVLRAFRDV